MAELEFFDPVLDDLVDSVPAWWQGAQLPDGELRLLLSGVASVLEDLAASGETIHADQALETATDAALRSEWAPLYGVAREDLPLDTETLRAYLQARAAEDGSISSLRTTLLSILHTPTNDGAAIQFPVDGSGLQFRVDGSGFGPLVQPSFDDSGLTFAADGSGLTFAAGGAGLTFPANGRLEILEAFTDYRLDVFVRSYLAFDRPAFARAVARFRQAHMVPSTITETAS